MFVDISICVGVMKDPVEFIVGVCGVFPVDAVWKNQRVVEIVR